MKLTRLFCTVFLSLVLILLAACTPASDPEYLIEEQNAHWDALNAFGIKDELVVLEDSESPNTEILGIQSVGDNFIAYEVKSRLVETLAHYAEEMFARGWVLEQAAESAGRTTFALRHASDTDMVLVLRPSTAGVTLIYAVSVAGG